MLGRCAFHIIYIYDTCDENGCPLVLVNPFGVLTEVHYKNFWPKIFMGTLAPLSRCVPSRTPCFHWQGFTCPKVLAQVGTPHSQNPPRLPAGAGWGPKARYPAKFGLKGSQGTLLWPNLSTFLFTHDHRGINMCHGSNWGARGSRRLKMAWKWAKMGPKALKMV